MNLNLPDVFSPIPLNSVKVSGLIGERINSTIQKNFFALDVEKDFLQPFRNKNSEVSYVGLGKLMDAAVHFSVYTNAPEVIRLKDHIFRELIKTQETDGYIGIKKSREHIWKEFDLHDEAHIISALLENFKYYNDASSLEAAGKLLTLLMKSWPEMPKKGGHYGHITHHMMTLGIEHTLLDMYELSGDEKYLDFCGRECGLESIDWPIQLERLPPLYGHSYMYLNLALAQLRFYRVRANKKLLLNPHRAVDFMLKKGGMTVIGGVGQSECWCNDQNGRGKHAETCSTAYQLRFFDSLMRMTGDSKYGDVMERMVYNALFAAQSPDGRKLRYYSPFEGKRVYWETDIYCCPNNFRRIVSELPGMIFYHAGDRVVINLYAAAMACIHVGSVPVNFTIDTLYPNDGNVLIHVDPEKPVKFRLLLRVPSWCSKATVKINGGKTVRAISGKFATVESLWTRGDTVRLNMKMEPRFVAGYGRQTGLAAVLRGPIVYSLNPANCRKNDDAVSRETIQAGDLTFTSDASLMGLESGDLTQIRIEIDSLKINPDGSIFLRADKDGSQIGVAGKLLLKLTPFSAPEGKCIYFHLSDRRKMVKDELFQYNVKTKKFRSPKKRK